MAASEMRAAEEGQLSTSFGKPRREYIILSAVMTAPMTDRARQVT